MENNFTYNSERLKSELKIFVEQGLFREDIFELTDSWINDSEVKPMVAKLAAAMQKNFNKAEKEQYASIFQICTDLCETFLEDYSFYTICDKSFSERVNLSEYMTFVCMCLIGTNYNLLGQSYSEFIYSKLSAALGVAKEYPKLKDLKEGKRVKKVVERFRIETLISCVEAEGTRFRKYRDKELAGNPLFVEKRAERSYNPSTSEESNILNGERKAILSHKAFDYTLNYFLSSKCKVDRPSNTEEDFREAKKIIEVAREKAFNDFWEPVWEKHMKVSKTKFVKEEYYKKLRRIYKKLSKKYTSDEEQQFILTAFIYAIEEHAEFKTLEKYLVQRKFSFSSPPEFHQLGEKIGKIPFLKEPFSFFCFLDEIPIHALKNELLIYYGKPTVRKKAFEIAERWHPTFCLCLLIFDRIFSTLEDVDYTLLIKALDYTDIGEKILGFEMAEKMTDDRCYYEEVLRTIFGGIV